VSLARACVRGRIRESRPRGAPTARPHPEKSAEGVGCGCRKLGSWSLTRGWLSLAPGVRPAVRVGSPRSDAPLAGCPARRRSPLSADQPAAPRRKQRSTSPRASAACRSSPAPPDAPPGTAPPAPPGSSSHPDGAARVSAEAPAAPRFASRTRPPAAASSNARSRGSDTPTPPSRPAAASSASVLDRAVPPRHLPRIDNERRNRCHHAGAMTPSLNEKESNPPETPPNRGG